MNILDKRATNPAAALDGTELVYVAQLGDDAVTTVQDIKDFATNGFVAKNAPITGATKTKITYNADGLITSGADATTADIADSPNRRYITDAQQTVLNNTSNTNSGDETQATIKTKLGQAASGTDGYLSGTDWTTFNGKQAALGNVITANTYGSSTQYPIVTVNAKGIVTDITLQTVPTKAQVYTTGSNYAVGDIVNHLGSTWTCNTAITSAPATMLVTSWDLTGLGAVRGFSSAFDITQTNYTDDGGGNSGRSFVLSGSTFTLRNSSNVNLKIGSKVVVNCFTGGGTVNIAVEAGVSIIGGVTSGVQTITCVKIGTDTWLTYG